MVDGALGGVQQFVMGLASGLSQLGDGDEEYLFLTYADADDWIRPYSQEPCRVLRGSLAPRSPRWKQWLRRQRWSSLAGRRTINLPKSDGTIEQAGVNIMHFTTQSGFLTNVPSIYHPWDLQHVHLPELFSSRVRLGREMAYRTFCAQARMVAVASAWGKRDLIQHYGLPADKVYVVPGAPVLSAYPTPSPDDLMAARRKFALPDAFVFYPAQTWAHKNHIGLLEALAILRDQHGLSVPLVSSGRLNEFFPKIEQRTRELQLSEQVRFLGFVSPLELQCLYRLCRCLVFPSQFEGWGMPLLEAFQAGVPVACANVTMLPELVGDAALLFDPNRPAQMAEAILALWKDEWLRQTLVERGRQNVARFSWDRTARLFRAHYRRIAGRGVTEEDRVLLCEKRDV